MSQGDGCCTWANCGMCGRCSSGYQANATCPQCGQDFWKGREDVGDLCDACCVERDARQDQRRLEHTRKAS